MRCPPESDDSPEPDEAMFDPRIPACLYKALRVYTAALRDAFPERVYAVSLYGSLALGGFSEHSSDVDFLTVMVGHITEDDQMIIRNLHQDIAHADPWTSRMDGEYIELEQAEAGEFDAPCLFVAHGRLAGRREVSKAGWLTLLQCGISVAGPEPAAFVPEVPWPDLEQEMDDNLNVYWTAHADAHLLFLGSSWVAFAVLTLCRIMYTLDRHAVTSKPAAAGYALGVLPVKWHQLIREALRLHSGQPHRSLYASRIVRSAETRRFIRMAVTFCDTRYGFRPPP
jgi:hypothetical protein